jgi:hypothetical protein
MHILPSSSPFTLKKKKKENKKFLITDAQIVGQSANAHFLTCSTSLVPALAFEKKKEKKLHIHPPK